MPGHAWLSVRQSPLVLGRFSFQDEGAGSSPARPTTRSRRAPPQMQRVALRYPAGAAISSRAGNASTPLSRVDAVALGGPTGVVGFGRVPAMAPEVLGNRYEIGRLIGRSAMTRVLEAWDRHGHRHVALKVLVDRLAADEAFLERLEREARTAARPSHRNNPPLPAVRGRTPTLHVG